MQYKIWHNANLLLVTNFLIISHILIKSKKLSTESKKLFSHKEKNEVKINCECVCERFIGSEAKSDSFSNFEKGNKV